jgi:CheY-like chemotaxis protein
MSPEEPVMWLLVEDDPDIRNVVAVMMQLWGEKPLALSDGNAAWSWLDGVAAGTFKGELPELALMDIRMPGHTGDQIAARIRTTERLNNIPIILMTAFTLTEAEVQNIVERAGIDHLIKKPLPDMDDFRSTLYRVRDERRKRAVISTAAPKSAGTATVAPSAPPKSVVVPPQPTTPSTAAKPSNVSTIKTAKLTPSPAPTPSVPPSTANGKKTEPSAPSKPSKPKS